MRGITVTLYERTQTGVDAFNAPVFSEKAVQVDNVLVTPVSEDDVIADTQLYGKHAVYELSLPKGDTHIWEDSRVDFFGQSFRVFGPGREWIEKLVPLSWNRKVRVERFE